jgi:hypothetical protein
MSFYDDLHKKESYNQAIEDINEELVVKINDAINPRYAFRPYQKSALNVFDWIVKKSITDTLIYFRVFVYTIYNIQRAHTRN